MRWLVELAVVALALTGLWVTVDKAAAGTVRAWEWARRDRVAPLLEDDDAYCYPECPPDCDCSRLESGEPELLHEWHDHPPLGYHDEAVPDCPACEARWELPPERSAADLGFGAERERRAEPWEAFQRIQYEAMGFEFPSGLMARVRELTP